ncbi:hypothetical protein N5079_05280 [Planotetraspora sp. A-T 1434]|uniref:hypothetical protein n=1 Tax=Planotetraspora sp. A-T 1434 TaxID=2979219 RepID=UPI0021C08AEA|nr:hypothetical protein [Planotetraspora sp. A-T 1434]MCT9929630.1 hypothetical protein [Planotetraspora sp. A-T 1434]
MPTSRISHPVFARLYTRVSEVLDQHGLAEHRRALLAGLSGRVIEIGAGNGLNFARYPPAVTGVVAIEPEPRLRATARLTATRWSGSCSPRRPQADLLLRPRAGPAVNLRGRSHHGHGDYCEHNHATRYRD